MEEIIFLVEESVEGYSARALGYSIFVQGDTIEELKSQIQDAIKCHFETDTPKLARLHFVREEQLYCA
ncbi:MAG: 2-oxoisovalerate dehydrogenase E1 subunit beta [Campylobacterales bacterium]